MVNAWRGRRVFLTGHTGFKGSWLALWLAQMGAEVRGYALDPVTDPNLFSAAAVGAVIEDVRGDIRDRDKVRASMEEFAPEVVFHLAAQPLVRLSYADPLGTFATNVMGTAHVLDAVRTTPSVRAVVSVTTDKCYENKEWVWPYRETDPLGGHDPYSSSKACAEIVSAAYRSSYFPVGELAQHGVALATARAGNVIGGGDWSTDRLIPDLIRGFRDGAAVVIRRPRSIRPWQHVLDPLHGYIVLAEHLLAQNSLCASAFNFGPNEDDLWPVERVAKRLADFWGQGSISLQEGDIGPHEAGLLRLDSSKARALLNWRSQLDIETALKWSGDWYRAWEHNPKAMAEFTLSQIKSYEERLRGRSL